MTLYYNYLLSQTTSSVKLSLAYLLFFIPILVIVILAFVIMRNKNPIVTYTSPFGPPYACNSPDQFAGTFSKYPVCPTINQDILNITKDEWKYFRPYAGGRFYRCDNEKRQQRKECIDLSNLLNNKKEAATSTINANSSLTSSQKTELLDIVDSTYNFLSSDWKNRLHAFRYYGVIPNDSPLCQFDNDYCMQSDSQTGEGTFTRYAAVPGNPNPKWSSLYNPTTEAPTTQAPDNTNEQEQEDA
jgi:hypothetical protein